jgi:protoheme IX farnesyltransferase
MESAARPRIADYVQMTRPRLGAMVLFTVAVGYFMGAGKDARVIVLLNTLLGTALVAAGASVLNQWMERKTDARMKRTANRPLPAGRLHSIEAFVFGALLGIGGTAYLALTLPSHNPAIIAATTLLSYVLIYTPLKRITVWNTVVGAIPGALPPLIGWCAARGEIDLEGASLFAILFVWQLPHFFAIAWLHRDDYAAGGMRMLPIVDPDGRHTAQAMIGLCVLLIPVSMGPALLQMTGQLFLVSSVFLSVYFLVCAMDFRRNRTRENARFVLKASLLYLAGLMLLLLIDGVLPRQLL